MFIGFITAFVVIFIIILAFKPNTRRTEVRKQDGSIEYHTTKETTAAGCAAKAVVFPLLILFIIAIITLVNISK